MSELYPGVEILATALDNLKNQSWVRVAPRWLSLVIGLVVLTAIYLAFRRGLHTFHIGVVTLGDRRID